MNAPSASTLDFSVRFSDAERGSGAPSADNSQRAIEIFAAQGFVRLENVFAAETMRGWKTHYERRYRRLLSGTDWPDRRPLFTVDIEGPFNTPHLYANPLVMPLVSHNVGSGCIVGALSTVISFPGAPDQRLHRDSQALFGDDYAVDKDIPPYAMTMLIPLVDCDHQTGCTKVWPGSHRRNEPSEAESTEPFEPNVAVGSVLITNSKLLHRGGANLSRIIRPLVYITYHRSWFRDFWGYETRRPVRITRRELGRVPAEYRHLFGWTRDPYPMIELRSRARSFVPRAAIGTFKSWFGRA